jgi:GH18 family chitinase
MIGCLALMLSGIAWTSMSAADGPPAAPTAASARIVGYLPDYRLSEFDPQSARALTDLIVFSATPSPDAGLDLSRLKKAPWDKFRQFKTRERVRLILCVGGWERSKHFAEIAASAEKRQKFVAAAVKICLDERLDGLDLDWEHPKNAAEQDGYGLLLADLHAAFQPHGLVLSVTIAGWQKLSPAAIAAADWVNVMAYDQRGKHSTFEGAQSDAKKLLDMGVPPAKLTLGLPFYGRNVTKPDQTATYREILARHKPTADADEIDGIYFNGPATIRKKTEWAIQSKLAGVMVWELGQDAPGEQSLLKVIRDTVDQANK